MRPLDTPAHCSGPRTAHSDMPTRRLRPILKRDVNSPAYTDYPRRTRETRFWVLDHEGSVWIASGMQNAGFRGLVASPRVGLVRHGVARCADAVRLEYGDTSAQVFRGLREKYLMGRLFHAVGYEMFDHDGDEPPETETVAVRLDPCDGARP